MNQPTQANGNPVQQPAQGFSGQTYDGSGAMSGTSPQQMQEQMAVQPPVVQNAAIPLQDQQTQQQEEVVAVRKNGDGDIVQLQLSSGRVVDYKTAQTMVKNNEIRNLNVFRGRDGDEHLRSNADGNPDNNLDALPTF